LIELPFVRLRFLALLGCATCVAAAAQGPFQPVRWSISASPVTSAKDGARLTLDLSAQFADGWHVYGLNQVDGGPTPLRIVVDPNGVVQPAGTPSGTLPTKKHDTSFDLETEVYLKPFNLHVPVQVKALTAAGNQEVGVNVRFQACNDHVCLPPKTVHLTVPVRIPSGTP